jgi:N-acetyl-anhydromuramyl-L-alanine amidase AmpD
VPGRPPAARGGSNLTPQILQELNQLIPLLTAFLARQSAHGAPRPPERSGTPEEQNFFEEPSFWHPKEESEDGRSIEEPIPDDAGLPMTEELGESPPMPEYPLATRFVPARYYESRSEPRHIRQIIIHITDGGANINGTISWFRNPVREGRPVEVSAHYIVGRDGEVVQMVRENDVAWHAGSANGESIGIEHNARAPGRGKDALYPTAAQYCSSAALVRWLCARYGVPLDRVHILGHAEADPSTRHQGCPNSVWNWDYHMSMVAAGACFPPSPGVTVGEQTDAVAEELLEEDVAFRWSNEAVLDLAD